MCKTATMKIVVLGSGYVGLVASAGLCEIGHNVTCVDCDRERIRELRRGILPIHEEDLPGLVAKHLGKRLHFSDELASAVVDSKVVFIAVGTPAGENGEADLSYVERVSRELASTLKSYTVIVEKSTVPIYTSKWIKRSMLMNGAPPELFDVVSNPEFLREGSAVVDFLYPDRIVVGGENDKAVGILQEVYEELKSGAYYRKPDRIKGPSQFPRRAKLITTSTESAELIKHVSNAFLALKISFINAVANICEAVGADITEVADGIGADQRIGPEFLRSGIGYGGSCFPKDLKAFRAVAAQMGCDLRLLDEVAAINEEQQRRFLGKLKTALWNLRGKHVAVLGLSFKGGTDDIRESPAVAILTKVLEETCSVSAYDPVAMPRVRELFTDHAALTFSNSAYDAVKGAEAVLILTDWSEFTQLDLARVRSLMKTPIMVDGRNLFDPERMAEKGFVYFSIGRGPVYPREFPLEFAKLSSLASVSALY